MKPIFSLARYVSLIATAGTLFFLSPAHADLVQSGSEMLAEPQSSDNTLEDDSSFLITNAVSTSSQHQPSKAAQKNQEVWDHVLPFGGQQAIYNGYDLPLPFGLSFIYTKVQQHQDISDIRVGANSFLGQLSVPMTDIDPELFRFDNFYTKVKTPQLKLDAWVLPFLNVFGTVGKLNGSADLDMTIGGDSLLKAVNHQLKPCTNLICRKTRQAIMNNFGHDYQISPTATIEGYTYTFGALIAGASGRWFYTMPITYTQTRMKKTTVDGNTINIQPRVGYGFDFNYGVKLNLYTGAGYMKTSQDISGSYSMDARKAVDDINTDNGLPFSVHQENHKPWAGIVGLALDINKYISADLEYTGLGGDRKQYLFMLNTRF